MKQYCNQKIQLQFSHTWQGCIAKWGYLSGNACFLTDLDQEEVKELAVLCGTLCEDNLKTLCDTSCTDDSDVIEYRVQQDVQRNVKLKLKEFVQSDLFADMVFIVEGKFWQEKSVNHKKSSYQLFIPHTNIETCYKLLYRPFCNWWLKSWNVCSYTLEQRIPAHKVIIASRSEVLSSMLDGRFLEGQQSESMTEVNTCFPCTLCYDTYSVCRHI